MFTRTLGRFGAAAVLVVGVLIATAAPASATVHDVVITGSSTILIQTQTTPPITTFSTHVQDHYTTNVCAPNSTTPNPIPIDFDSTGGGTIGASNTNYADFVIGTNTFKTRLNILSGTVTLSATGITVNLTLRAEFKNCASTTTLCITTNIGIVLTGPNPTGTHHPTASTTFTVSGSSTPISVAAFPACNVILRAALLNNVAVANLNLHVTT